MNRRAFMGTLAGGVLAAPLAAAAQQARVYRIGVLDTLPMARNAANLDGFRQGLRDLGYVEGQDFVLEYRWPANRANAFPDLANELVSLKVDLILTRGTRLSPRPSMPRERSRSSWQPVAILSGSGSSPGSPGRGGMSPV